MREYNRKTDRQSWEPTQMAKAVEAVAGGTPLKTAADNYNVARNSLRRRIVLYKAEYGNMELTVLKGFYYPLFIYRVNYPLATQA